MELIQVNRAGILDAAGGIWCRTPSHPGRVLLHRRGAASLGVAPTRVMSCPGLSHRDGAPTLNGAATLVGLLLRGSCRARSFAPGAGAPTSNGVVAALVGLPAWGAFRARAFAPGGGAPTLNVPPRPR